MLKSIIDAHIVRNGELGVLELGRLPSDYLLPKVYPSNGFYGGGTRFPFILFLLFFFKRRDDITFQRCHHHHHESFIAGHWSYSHEYSNQGLN